MAVFADVLKIINGKNQKAVENPNGKYPIYGSGGIMGYADDYICKADTVIIGRKGSINNPIYVTTPFWNVDTAFGLEANTEVLSPRYLYYFCLNFDFEKLNTTVTIPSLTKQNLLKIEIPLPPLSTQKQIAATLDKATQTIDLCNAILEKLDLLVKARFVEMFGEASEYKSLPLKECCAEITGGGTPSMKHPEYYGGDIPFIKSGDVKENTVSKGALSLTDIALKETTAKLLPKGTIVVVVRSAALLREFHIAISNNPIVINQDLKAITPTKHFSALFLMWAIKMKEQIILGKVQTMLTSHIRMDDFLYLDIPLAPIEIQQQFAAFVEKTDRTKAAVKQVLAKAETLKKALMQEYFG